MNTHNISNQSITLFKKAIDNLNKKQNPQIVGLVNKATIADVESVFQSLEAVVTKPGLNIQIGYDTDIGGNRDNQDRYSVFTTPEHEVCAISVADGHSAETGHFVADITKKCLEKLLETRITELIANPVSFLEFCCDYIHEQIRIGLVEIMEKNGYNVKVDESGVILKNKHEFLGWNELKGGTTFSIIVLIGRKIYMANVGDSSGLLCCKHPILKTSHIKYEKDAANPTKEIRSEDTDSSPSTYLELTRDHSPESIEEYTRMRAFKCSDEDPNHAELLCVYDKQYTSKPRCPNVFDISESGIPSIRNDDGSFEYYIKNVRKEKASYVTDRPGDNTLSVTRALGDFKLQTLGLSNKPEIQSIDLEYIFQQLKLQIDAAKVDREKDDTETVKPVDPMSICVVLCTDGVWDNWIYEDVCKFVMDPSCLNAVVADPEKGAARVAKSFMLRNQAFARKNFGSQSDNATGIVMYITQEE
jgi:serine/threonine protein phosphatase PrpC